MEQSSRQRISRLAESLHKALELELPTDVDQAVKRLGGSSIVTNDLPVGTMAQIEKHADTFVIKLREDAGDRHRYSIAHEIGHLLLHMGYMTDAELWARTGSYQDSVLHRFGFSEEEYEANEFALSFLMPRVRFLEAARSVSDSQYVDVVQLASELGVDVDHALERGKSLGAFGD